MYKFLPIVFLLTACTFSINQVHTDGEATDIVDENQSATSDISPDLSSLTAPIFSAPKGINGPDRQAKNI